MGKLLLLIFTLVCSGWSQAQDATKILAFNQYFDLIDQQKYEVVLPEIAASDQVWSAVYVVLQDKTASGHYFLDLQLLPQGILFKNNPALQKDSLQVESDQIARVQKYSFKEFEELNKLLEKQTSAEIKDTQIFDTTRARVMGRVDEWVPQYNHNGQSELSVQFPQLEDVEVKAVYLIVGQGEKPNDIEKIAALNPAHKFQGNVAQNTAKNEARRSIFEARWLIWGVILCAMIYLGWNKTRG